MDKLNLSENWSISNKEDVDLTSLVETTEESTVAEAGEDIPVDVKSGKSSINATNSSYVVSEVKNFDKMGLNINLLKGIFSVGFENPSIIQQKAIIPLSEGRDIIAQSQSGTGKTGAFSIGSLNRVDPTLKQPQILVLAPTRELAKQIYDVFSSLSNYMSVDIELCMGGMRNIYDGSIKSQIIVGTPGRVFDYLRRGIINNEYFKLFIMDEADEMLSQGFKEQIYDIFKFIPKTTQIGLFSATIPPEVLDITKRFMDRPLRILLNKEELTLEGIRQFYYGVNKEDDKFLVLCNLYNDIEVTQCIIYTNSVKKTYRLARALEDNDFTVSVIAGDMTQVERTRILDSFKSGETRILLTTNLLSRGIDIQQVSLVINYDIPFKKQTYIHRIGRSGRFGRKGTAINFVTYHDAERLREIEEYYSTEIQELPANIAEIINSI